MLQKQSSYTAFLLGKNFLPNVHILPRPSRLSNLFGSFPPNSSSPLSWLPVAPIIPSYTSLLALVQTTELHAQNTTFLTSVMSEPTKPRGLVLFLTE